MKKAMIFVAITLVAALAVSASVAGFLLVAGPGKGIPPQGILFTVKEGQGASSVAGELEAGGLVRSAFVFKLLARIEGAATGLKAGTYQIEPSMGTKAILELLLSGRQALVRVTIPEGYTLTQVAGLLEARGILAAPAFVEAASDPTLLKEEGIAAASFEGYLFPDTYFLPHGLPAAAAIRLMVGDFRKKLAERFPESANMSQAELKQRLIVASIVEREYRVSSEAPYMASVFYNRLRIGMALQSCATVVYVITEKLGKPHPDVVYTRDLKIADAYNTYMQRGLPPGPICSPGATALDAAFHPAISKYLYFRLVNAEAGVHHFSETLEEHNEAATLSVKKVGG